MEKIKQLIEQKLVFEKNGRKYIALGNCRLDFKQTYLFLGFTKSGKLKIAEIYSTHQGGEPDSVRNRYANVEETETEIKVWTDGYNYSERISKEVQ